MPHKKLTKYTFMSDAKIKNRRLIGNCLICKNLKFTSGLT